MVNMIIHGCGGAMGQVLSELAAEDGEIQVAAGIDPRGGIKRDYPVYESFQACGAADVVVDFSTAAAVDGLLEYCKEKRLPLVLCTTGLSQCQLEKVQELSETVPVLRSANMSLGVNLLLKLVKEGAKVLGISGFDMEIVEKHHNQKVDAPSGTALALADAVNEALDDAYTYKYDRSQDRKKRDRYEIGISAVRGGTIVGDHDVIFAGTDEVVTFSHRAYSKAVFGKGAVQAAKFLAGKPAGHYQMSDVIEG